MKLDESLWVLGGGNTPEWRGVNRSRLDDVYARLRRVAAALPRQAPESIQIGRAHV